MIRLLKDALRPAYHALRPPMRSAPFDSLFPEAEKMHYVPPATLDCPELPSLPPFWPAYRRWQQDTLTLAEDYVAVVDEAVFCPLNNVVMNSEGVMVEETRAGGRGSYSPYSRRYLKRKRSELQGYATILRGPPRAYYHVVIDYFPRLLSLWNQPFCDLDEIKLLTSTPLSGWQRYLVERLAPPNARVVEVARDKPIAVEHLILTPFKSARGYLPARYRDALREKLLPTRPSKRNRRLLISRQGAPKRRIANFNSLEERLREYGFTAVQPEKLSMEDEIELFYDAEIIAGAHGSGLTNILFAESAHVIELFATPHIVPHFLFMCKSLGHSYDYLLGTGDSIVPEEYTVDVDRVVEKVRSLVSNSVM